MPNCTILLHRHSGLDGLKIMPSDFVVKKLRPLLESNANGSAVHVIHDRMPRLPVTSELRRRFESMASNDAVINGWKREDKMWRLSAKTQLAMADYGENSVLLNSKMNPDAEFILEFNRKRPRSVINHLGFYPLEAAIENTRYQIHIDQAVERAGSQDLRGSVEHLMGANEALASCNLLRDVEMVKQIVNIGTDVVVLRSMDHIYLADLEEYDISIAIDSHTVMNFADIVKRHGITITAEEEDVALTFSEEAVNIICSGGIDREAHRRLALLQVMMIGVMNMEGMPQKQEDRIRLAYLMALDNYEKMRAEIYG